MSSYVGRSFIIYLDPMGAPGQVNSRNYGDDYYMVITPGNNGIKIDQIRHTYLHFVLDPLILKRANAIHRISPILNTISEAPLEDSYKRDASLLVTECLIRAIEARLVGGPKGPEPPRVASVQASMREGFVLTQYFYDQLIAFEKDPAGLKDSYGQWLTQLNVQDETKRARGITFSQASSADVVRTGRKRTILVDQAERLLAAGDVTGAERLAHQAITAHEQSDRALFLLARASLRDDIAGAKTYFSQTLEATADPKLKAWSHIYLGRISDLNDEREEAVKHYKAALEAGDASPETKAAAERGIREQFQPPKAQQKD
jgi:tetratricopeptide (TPR) repeat protein